tara:strand:- start:368 stop:1291 length:924 start_codon:yes stop_codon:yes gene_type:complete
LVKKSVIITGNNGFVGNNLSLYLKEKQIIGVSRNPSKYQINYEELNTTLINKSVGILHLAGKAHDLKNTSEEKEYFNVNTELTKRLFNLFLKSDCEIFIYMSSVKAVSDSLDIVLKESKLPNPKTAYGKSKLAAETYILSKKVPKDKRVYILRPCMIHGPGNKGNLNILYKFISSRIPWPLGAFKNQRSYCSVENLLFIIKELIENKAIQSGIYNVSDDKPLSTNKVILLIAKSLERNYLILKFPVNLVRLLSRLGDIIKLPLNSENLKKLTESYVVCNKKIIQAIGKKLPIRSEEGMLKTFESFNK